jgi:hypothetical protein
MATAHRLTREGATRRLLSPEEASMMARSVEANMTLNVVVVSVPEESERLEQLRAADVPRLVVVAAGTDPPTLVGDCEEWIRFPADAGDVVARLEALTTRARRRAALRPSLDNDGLLHLGTAWVSLSGPREPLAKIFVADFGRLVPTGALLGALQKKKTYPIRQPISRLRRSIEPLGLEITCVKPHGWVMHLASGILTRPRTSQRSPR